MPRTEFDAELKGIKLFLLPGIKPRFIGCVLRSLVSIMKDAGHKN